MVYVWGMPSGRRPITRELYDSLVIAFRECPGNASFAARQAGCERRMANRGWLKGWPHTDWAKPIKDVLESEKLAAAAALRQAALRAEEAREAERESARQESIEARKQELQMMKAARADTVASLVLISELIAPMRQLVRAVTKACQPGPDGSAPDIPATVAMGLLTRFSQMVQKSVGATEAMVQLTRLERGESTANVAVSVQPETLTYEDAIEELEAIGVVLGGAAQTLPQRALLQAGASSRQNGGV